MYRLLDLNGGADDVRGNSIARLFSPSSRPSPRSNAIAWASASVPPSSFRS
jgi:hypothetical protein